MRVLGIDPGGKRLGMALADLRTGIVTPLAVLAYDGRTRAASTIAAAMDEHEATIVVIGLPTDPEGRETPACTRSRALAAAVDELGAATALQPEHLSTNEARRRARAIGRRPGAPVDDLAAQVILEEYLEGRGSTGDPE
jgi:putative Holliday junction resolvase